MPSDNRDKEKMVEVYRDMDTVKEALDLDGQPFHAEVRGNGVMFVYPQLEEDVE